MKKKLQNHLTEEDEEGTQRRVKIKKMLESTIALLLIALVVFFIIAERKFMASILNWVSRAGDALKKNLTKNLDFFKKKKTISAQTKNLVMSMIIDIPRKNKKDRVVEVPNYRPPLSYDDYIYQKYWLMHGPIPERGEQFETEINGDIARCDYFWDYNEIADLALAGDYKVGMWEHIYVYLVKYKPPNPFKYLAQGTQAWWEEIERLRRRRHVEFMEKADKFLGTLDKWRLKWAKREIARLRKVHEDYIIYNEEVGLLKRKRGFDDSSGFHHSVNDQQSWLFDERAWWRVKGGLIDRLHEIILGKKFLWYQEIMPPTIGKFYPSHRAVTHHFADYFYAMQDAYRILRRYRRRLFHLQYADDVDMPINDDYLHHFPRHDRTLYLDFLTLHNPKTGQPIHLETSSLNVKDRAAAIKCIPDLKHSIKDWYYSRFIVHPYEVDYEYRNIQGALKVMRLGRGELRERFIDLYTHGQASGLKLENKYSFLHRNVDMMNFFYKFDFLDFAPFFLILGAFSIVFYCFHFFFREGWLEFGEWGVFGKNKHMMAGGDFLFEKIRFLVYPIVTFWCLWIFFFWGWLYHSMVESSYQDFFGWFWLSAGYAGEDWEREIATLQSFTNAEQPIDNFQIYTMFVKQVLNHSNGCLVVFVLAFVLYVKKQLIIVFKQFKNELGTDDNIAYSNIFDSMHIYRNFFVSQKSSDLTLETQKKLFTTWLGAYDEKFKKSFIWKAFIILKVLILFFFISMFIKNIAFKQTVLELSASYRTRWKFYTARRRTSFFEPTTWADDPQRQTWYTDADKNYDDLMSWIALNRWAKHEFFEVIVNRFAEMWGDFIFLLLIFLFFFCFVYLAFVVENHAKIESRICFYDRGLQEIAEFQEDDEKITTHFDPKVAKTLIYEYHDIDETPLLSAFYSLRFYESSVLDEKKKDEVSTVEEGLMLTVFRVFMMEKEYDDDEMVWKKEYYMRPITELYGNLENYSIWDEHLDEQYEDDEEWADDDMIDLDSELLHLELDRFAYIKWFLANVESEPVCYMEIDWEDDLSFFSTEYDDDEETWKL